MDLDLDFILYPHIFCKRGYLGYVLDWIVDWIWILVLAVGRLVRYVLFS